ncbi:MAG: hypothetical protein WCI29_10960 [Actinomycetes bacterium]|jgi:hypothetical protein
MTTPAGIPERPVPAVPPQADSSKATADAPFDPLRLCIYTTVALIAWILGPFAVLGFAILGLAGYWRAHQAGLTRSRCYLGDVRLVLAYLGLIAVIAAVAAGVHVMSWLG